MIPFIIKFGGSVITRQDSEDPFDAPTTARLAEELARREVACIVVHGTGAVGKPAAVKHGYAHDGRISADRQLLASEIRHNLRQLNQRVVATLLAAGMAACSVEASQLFAANLGELRHANAARMLLDLVNNGCTPVLHGDHVPCPDGSWRVLSSDIIVAVLARELAAEHVIFLTDVEGVYGDGPEGPYVLAELAAGEEERLAEIQAARADVSGGMSAKVNCALEVARHGSTCHIASGRKPGVLNDLLSGKNSGTRIHMPSVH